MLMFGAIVALPWRNLQQWYFGKNKVRTESWETVLLTAAGAAAAAAATAGAAKTIGCDIKWGTRAQGESGDTKGGSSLIHQHYWSRSGALLKTCLVLRAWQLN